MNIKVARRILRGCAWSGADDREREIVAAKKRLAKDTEFLAEFAQQREFDELLGDRIEQRPAPEIVARLDELAAKLTAGAPKRNLMRDPAMMAAGFAFLVLAALIAWIVVGSGGVFSGMGEIEKLAKAGDRARIEQFEPVETSAGTLGDWFVMQGFDGFRVPQGFEDLKVVGVRIFDYEGEAVAVAAIAEPRSFVYVFHGEPLGLELPEGEWRIEEYDGGSHAFAVCQMGPIAFLTTFKGDGEEMKSYIAGRQAAP